MANEVTKWAKIVPRRDTADPAVGLAARVADPLWMLARQYQFGEFTGDDGAEPVTVEVQVTWTPMTRWQPGDTPAGPVDGLLLDRTHQPIESLVEDDRALVGARVPRLTDVVEAGARLCRSLRRAGLDVMVTALLADHATICDPRSSSDNADLFATRTVDGFAVRAALASGLDSALPAALDAAQRATATTLLQQWIEWFDGRFGFATRTSAWVQDRLEHRFSVAAPHPDGGELVFSAPEYLGQGVSWHELDLVAPGPASLGAAADAAQTRSFDITAKFPQRIRWPGMPVNRFWEMEDAAVDFGAVTLDPTDIAGLLAVDMAVTASTDWFVVGVPLPVGGVARIDSVVVTDVFEDRTLIRLGPDVRRDLGHLYEPAVVGGAAMDTAWLLLPPALVRRVDGSPLEDVMLIRDEMANLAWAVELIAPLDDGEPVDVASRLPPKPPTIHSSAVPLDALEYRLTSGVPDNWRPLVPVRDPVSGRRVFVPGQVWGSQHPQPFTVLVEQLGTILDEEVPREGKRLRRFWQYGRWHDGSRHLWCGREVLAGRGEGNSGLRYDLAT